VLKESAPCPRRTCPVGYQLTLKEDFALGCPRTRRFGENAAVFREAETMSRGWGPAGDVHVRSQRAIGSTIGAAFGLGTVLQHRLGSARSSVVIIEAWRYRRDLHAVAIGVKEVRHRLARFFCGPSANSLPIPGRFPPFGLESPWALGIPSSAAQVLAPVGVVLVPLSIMGLSGTRKTHIACRRPS